MGFEEFQKKATPERKSIMVCPDRRLLSELEAARAEMASRPVPREGTNAMLSDPLRDRISKLEAKVKRESEMFVFESVGRKQWQDLLAEHPPTEEQQKEAKGFLDHNPETFPAAAIAASCVEPGLTVEQAQWLLVESPLPVEAVARVWVACVEANVNGSPDPLGDGFSTALAGAKKSKRRSG